MKIADMIRRFTDESLARSLIWGDTDFLVTKWHSFLNIERNIHNNDFDTEEEAYNLTLSILQENKHEDAEYFTKKYPECIMENVYHEQSCASHNQCDCDCTPTLRNDDDEKWLLADGDLLLIEDGKPVVVLWEGEAQPNDR